MDNTQLTIQDLAALHSILETACNRAAFKPGELRQVGEVYEKLTHFLKAAQSQPAPQPAPPPPPPQEATNDVIPVSFTTQGDPNA